MTAVGIDVGKASLDVAVEGKHAVKRFANSRQGLGEVLRCGDRDNPSQSTTGTSFCPSSR